LIDTVRVRCVKVNCNAATCINEKIVGISAFTTGRPPPTEAEAAYYAATDAATPAAPHT
jgi:hypothetical protein